MVKVKQYAIFSLEVKRPHARSKACAGVGLLFFVLAFTNNSFAQTPQTAPKAQSAPVAVAPVEQVYGVQDPTPPARVVTSPAPALYALYAPPTPQQAQSRPTTPAPVAAPRKPTAPKNVVTVVHRLNGWKLLSWLAVKAGEGVFVDELPSPDDVHTNIVAGVVSDDGRTVMARLPRAEVEVESNYFTDKTPGLYVQPPGQGAPLPSFTLIRSDGKAIEAKFVGLDATTGLSLLEAKESLWVSAPAAPWPPVATPALAATPAVGQRVRLYAPAQAAAPPVAAPITPFPAVAPTGDAGDTGVVYFSIGETQGQLTQVKRTSSGQPVVATVRSKNITPEMGGAAVMNYRGQLLGILGDTGNTESEIVPVEAMRLAKERLLARRASVPRPWLGVRGDALNKLMFEQFWSKDATHDYAQTLLKNHQGVLLTSVEPGAPASRAGLKPGDIISRVDGQYVRGVEEFTRLLREAGAGAKLNLEVLRAMELEPLRFSVELSSTFDKQRSTARQKVFLNPLARYGVELVGLTHKSAASLGVAEGQLVVAVRDESPAADAGLRSGDVIVSVNGEPLAGPRWRSLTAPVLAEVSVEVVRKGQRLTLKVAPPKAPQQN